MRKPNGNSICKCGHNGDGQHTEHAGVVGHGHCMRCGCGKFTWASFTPAFLAEQRQKARRRANAENQVKHFSGKE